MSWLDFPVDPEIEAGFSDALREAPPGGRPAPATLRVVDFLRGLGVGAAIVLVLHVGLGLARLAGPTRYAIEASALIVVGYVLMRWLKGLSQEGRAVDAKGNPLPGDAVLAAYRSFVLGATFRAAGEAVSIRGPAPAALARPGTLVGRTADRLVLSRYDAEARRLLRAGIPLAAVRAVTDLPGGGSRVELDAGPLDLEGIPAYELRDLLAAGPAPGTEAAPAPDAPSASADAAPPIEREA